MQSAHHQSITFLNDLGLDLSKSLMLQTFEKMGLRKFSPLNFQGWEVNFT